MLIGHGVLTPRKCSRNRLFLSFSPVKWRPQSVLMYPVTWVAVQHSDAYAKAIEFLRGNGKVNESVGEVEEVGLSFFGYSLRYSGAYGEANFEVELEGSNTTASAYVELKKKGVWEVTMASVSVPGQQPMRLK